MVQATIAPWAEEVPGIDRLVTADELLAWPEDPQFPWQYELVAGRLVRMPPTGLEHWDVTMPFLRAVDRFVEARALGLVTLPDTGFRVSRPGEAHTVLSPDIAFVSAERLALLPAPGTPERRKHLPVAPDLAVEIPSPDQYRPEMAAKARLYLSLGVRLVWTAWAKSRQVDLWLPDHDEPVAILGVGDQLDGLAVLPDFTYPVAALFR